MTITPISGASITKGIPVIVEVHHECDKHGEVAVKKRFMSQKNAEEWVDKWLDDWDCY